MNDHFQRKRRVRLEPGSNLIGHKLIWNRLGELEMELEHGEIDPETNVTGDDPLLTGKIGWAHLKFPLPS